MGLIGCAPDPTHKQKLIYSLTEAAIQLVPVMATLGEWGRRHLPVTHELSVRARLLWEEFMEELRELHLGRRRAVRASAGPGVLERLNDAYLAASKKGRTR